MMKWGLMFTECSLVSLRVGVLNLSMADTARNFFIVEAVLCSAGC